MMLGELCLPLTLALVNDEAMQQKCHALAQQEGDAE